jgi:hypothetical protein
MLGELIYEHKAKVTGNRVLDVEGPVIETSYSGSGKYKGGVEVTDIGTYWAKAKPSGALYGEGQGFDDKGWIRHGYLEGEWDWAYE